jgi:hypothetical protein
MDKFLGFGSWLRTMIKRKPKFNFKFFGYLQQCIVEEDHANIFVFIYNEINNKRRR